jgi:hypothetical protein
LLLAAVVADRVVEVEVVLVDLELIFPDTH